MEFSFTKFPSADGVHPFQLRPLIPMVLYRGAAKLDLYGQLDTGADMCILNSHIADNLFIDWKHGTKIMTRGVNNRDSKVFVVNGLQLEISGLSGSRIDLKMGVMESLPVTLLLGQWGFFEHFVVTMRRGEELFSIDLRTDATHPS